MFVVSRLVWNCAEFKCMESSAAPRHKRMKKLKKKLKRKVKQTNKQKRVTFVFKT